MIFICEPTCRGVDHERVNSGFICALGAAYPSQNLRVYAHTGHAAALRDTIARDGWMPPRIEFVPIQPPSAPGSAAAATYKRIFRRVFDAASAAGIDKVFVLSFDVEALRAVKQLKRSKSYKKFKLSFVVHGVAEALVEKKATGSAVKYPWTRLPHRSIGRRLQRATPSEWPQMLLRGIRSARQEIRKALGVRQTSVREVMEVEHSSDYRYIFLAPHAARNAAINLPAIRNEAFAVTMPVKLLEPKRPSQNQFAKFAAYGNVDALALHNVAKAVHERQPRARYEIRLIGGNHFAVEDIPNVTCVGTWGRKLDREQMEAHAFDIDYFMLLFDATRYCLTCSGVLFEALSLVKPVIHFANECVDQFNTAQTPIGVRCASFEQYIHAMIDIIENYSDRQHELARYRRGILNLRVALEGQNVTAALRQSFDW